MLGWHAGRLVLLAAGLLAVSDQVLGFRIEESARRSAVAYWQDTSHCRVDTGVSGKRWVANLTPEASTWLWQVNKARGLSKAAVFAGVKAQNATEAKWVHWIDAKLAYDTWQASRDAAARNAADRGDSSPPSAKAPTDPGPAPTDLVALVNQDPPAEFMAVVAPTTYTVTFPDGMEISASDNVTVPKGYPYLRSAQGIRYGGTPLGQLPSDELDRVFAAAGISGSQKNVIAAVSKREGGFDAVNTYDTGYVSIGFIQFACLAEGGGSLGRVLLREKAQAPQAFANDFQRFGIDVTPEGKLEALDLETGDDHVGGEAAQIVIRDKRLALTFAHAGATSMAFRVAQLQVAKDEYYPGQDKIKLQSSKGDVSYTVSEVIRSEAGLATIMDRKVSTGHIDPLPETMQNLMINSGFMTADDFAGHEGLLVSTVAFRCDFTQDPSLSQPVEAHWDDIPVSRSDTTRFGRSEFDVQTVKASAKTRSSASKPKPKKKRGRQKSPSSRR